MSELCSRFDTCLKTVELRDGDMFSFQFRDGVEKVCGKCKDFTIGEQDELLLTPGEAREAIKAYCDDQGIEEMPEFLPLLEYHFIAKAQLAKVKQRYVKWDREKVAEFLESYCPKTNEFASDEADQLKEILTGGE